MTVDAVGLPLVDQYLLQVLPTASRLSAGAPIGSAAFRRALRDISATTGLLPTRRETTAAAQRLRARGLLEGAPR